MTKFEQIKELFNSLSKEQQQSLLSELSNISFLEDISPENVTRCGHCKSVDIIKYGVIKGQQRFMCKSCKRSFSATTGTLIHNVKKKDKFIEYSKIVKEEGLRTISYMKKRLGISTQSSFDWRHRLLLSTDKKKEKFEEEIQMDDIWFLYSQKGRRGLEYSRVRGGSKHKGDNNYQVKLLAASDKFQVELKVAKIGRISEKDIIQAVGEKFKASSKLVTDKHKSFEAFAKGAKLEHVSFLAKNHKAATGENVQYINNISERLKTWINRSLRGVSTKYLQLYANYFAFCEKGVFDIKRTISNTTVWDTYTNIESFYKRFILNKSVRTYRCPTKRRWKSQNWNSKVINELSYI